MLTCAQISTGWYTPQAWEAIRTKISSTFHALLDAADADSGAVSSTQLEEEHENEPTSDGGSDDDNYSSSSDDDDDDVNDVVDVDT